MALRERVEAHWRSADGGLDIGGGHRTVAGDDRAGQPDVRRAGTVILGLGRPVAQRVETKALGRLPVCRRSGSVALSSLRGSAGEKQKRRSVGCPCGRRCVLAAAAGRPGNANAWVLANAVAGRAAR